MKLLLIAINAKYIHSNPAIYCLSSYASQYEENIELAEFTINQNIDDVLRIIYEKRADVICFSCYIWNISMVRDLMSEYRKLDAKAKIWAGGPEVSYDAAECLKENEALDGVMVGEGEETFLELCSYYIKRDRKLSEIKGLVYKTEDHSLIETGLRMPVDFARLPFLYEKAIKLSKFKNRIIYYETSRGCPFSCSYCLSSIDKRVRFRDLSLVEKELAIFLEKKVPQVKFIDRTFNCNRSHAMHIWKFIKEHDNGITNFHFEIAADLLNEEELSLLSTMREGLVQLEIGVQSTNPETIHAIHRHMDLDKVKYNVAMVKKNRNIHQHLDLIAGLPYEDYNTFGESFNDVYAMEPDQLQLGFLKVLKGSYMQDVHKEYGICYHSRSPYEVLYTKWLPYEDVCRLKDLEEMVEVYYNSGQFKATIGFLRHCFSTPFAMFEALAEYYRKNDLFEINHSRVKRYLILLDFSIQVLGKEKTEVLKETMIFDLYLREKLKARPSFAKDSECFKKIYKNFLSNHAKSYGIGECVHIEHFTYDIFAAQKQGEIKKRDFFVVFDYSKEKSLFRECSYEAFDLLQ